MEEIGHLRGKNTQMRYFPVQNCKPGGPYDPIVFVFHPWFDELLFTGFCQRVASHFQCIPSNSTKWLDIAAYFILSAIPAFSFSWLQKR